MLCAAGGKSGQWFVCGSAIFDSLVPKEKRSLFLGGKVVSSAPAGLALVPLYWGRLFQGVGEPTVPARRLGFFSPEGTVD